MIRVDPAEDAPRPTSSTRPHLASHAARSAPLVAALNYRLAPQNVFPVQGDDVQTAVSWLKQNASRLHLDASRIAFLGRAPAEGRSDSPDQLEAALGRPGRDGSARNGSGGGRARDLVAKAEVCREDDAREVRGVVRGMWPSPTQARGGHQTEG
jgi:hypothetical protein